MGEHPVLPAPPVTNEPAPIGYAPKPGRAHTAGATLAALEAMLAEWFQRPVLLLGSGRAGMIVYSKLIGASRHRDTCRVPPFLPTCVTDTISRFAFPVIESERPGLTLIYHQYGFPQVSAPPGRVLEDICHAFFAAPGSGARPWHSDAAVFSLPKFFGLPGMAGGLVLADEAMKAAAREALQSMPAADAPAADFIRDAVTRAKLGKAADGGAYLEAAYALLNHFLHPDAASLAGMPAAIADLRSAGQRRREIVESYLACASRGMPEDFRSGLTQWTPFAFPYFGARDAPDEERIRSTLSRAGVAAGVYHVDVARNSLAPEYRRCVLIPCHQDVPAATVAAVEAVIGR